jgi:hypothetical protein
MTENVSIPAISDLLLKPFGNALAAYELECLRMGVPVHKVLGMLLNHLCSVVAQVEPAGAREELIKDLVASFAPMTRKHVDLKHTTKGGVILPNHEITNA